MVKCHLITSYRNGGTLAKKSEASKETIALIDNTDKIPAHQGMNGVHTRLLTLEPGSEFFPKTSFISFYDDAGPQAVTFWIEYRNVQSLLGNRSITFDQESLERIVNMRVR